jgi:hypothetical protein
MAFFRKRPITVEARQLGQDYDEDIAIARWCGARLLGDEDVTLDGHPGDASSLGGSKPTTGTTALIKITTREGVMYAMPGDWIIKGTAGEFYPCKPEIFNEIYETVQE